VIERRVQSQLNTFLDLKNPTCKEICITREIQEEE
jgi:hypothetical protein